MVSEQVTLRFSRSAPVVRVRELTGHDERQVREASTRAAVELLSRLVEAPREWSAEELTAPDRDRLLATVFRRTFGTQIESTATCTACASPFDLSVSIDELAAAVDQAASPHAAEPLGDGTFRTTAGLRFRLPSARDEMEAAALPAGEAARKLAARCALEAPEGADVAAAVEVAIEDLAPLLDLDLTTRCPECGAGQAVHFDVQFFLLRAIEQERAQLMREIHRIASAYGWSLEAILDLRRSERRSLVDLIDAELPSRRRVS